MEINSVVRALFASKGQDRYGENVSQLEHALQAAALAEQENAAAALITAALLHDVGHLLGKGDDGLAAQGIDARHEASGARFLSRWFGPQVTEPVRLHVNAKAYLCFSNPDYYDTLSEASKISLRVQGGVMSAEQAEAFRDNTYCDAAVRLRIWDDEAKVKDRPTPGLEHFLQYLERAASATG